MDTIKPVILVADDEADSLKLLTDILTAEGYEVRAADSGELALASAAAHTPDLILLDLRMPGIDGLEVCRRLKASTATSETPLMFISGASDVEQRVQGLAVGAVDFVVKPFRREELVARVRTHLELGRLRANLEREVAHRTAELRTALEELGESEERFVTWQRSFAQARLALTLESISPASPSTSWTSAQAPAGSTHGFAASPAFPPTRNRTSSPCISGRIICIPTTGLAF